MKAILVIDIPEKCLNCKLMTNDMYCKGFTPYYTEDGTHITRMCVEDEVMRDTRHIHCPLKPLPQRKKSLVVADGDGARFEEPTEFEQGWNTCIDEILGEEQ